ncbi:MAG TPA: hypothetical protein VNX01_07040 [Bacteroidia bacterium]|jgi:hypothetical protein|nr:hypothetical protein [Bacteroidia bacterium]
MIDIIEEKLGDSSDCNRIKTSEIASFNSSADYSISKFNEQTLTDFKKNTPVFLRMVREENFEIGFTNNLDKLVADLIERNPMIAIIWLNNIYVNYYSDTKVLLALLFTISRIDNNLIRQSLVIIAIAGLAHSDIEIRESSIMCFENWGDISSLNGLKDSIKDPVDWIQEYKEQVILDIEKSLS